MKADVDGSGIGYGLRLITPVNTTLSLRLNIFRSTATGLSYHSWTHSSVSNPIGGGLVENIYQIYRDNQEGWFPSYRFSQSTFEIEGIININKLINKQLDINFEIFDLFILGSYGIFSYKTELDLLDKNGSPYTNLLTKTNWTYEKFDTKDGRKEIRENLSQIYDGNYESEFIGAIRNKTYSYGGGLKVDLNTNLNLGLEYKIINYHDFDYADGIRFRTSNALTLDNDSARYLNLFLEFKF